MDLLQGLRLCQEAWNPGSPWDRQGAQAALWGRPPGVTSQSLYFYCCTCVLFCVFGLCICSLRCLHVEVSLKSCICNSKPCFFGFSNLIVSQLQYFHILLVPTKLWFGSWSVCLDDANLDYGNDYDLQLTLYDPINSLMKDVLIHHCNCAYNFGN